MIHHFSISNSPTEEGYLEFTTRLRDSEFKNALRKLKEGEMVNLKAPYGEFIIENVVEKIGMLSGGIGIAPLRSMIRYCTDKNLRKEITLLYGSRAERDIIFRDELEDIQRKNPNFKVVHILSEADDNWRGYKGIIDKERVKKEIPDFKERVFYSCGPPLMVEAMDNILSDIGIKKENIRKENLYGY